MKKTIIVVLMVAMSIFLLTSIVIAHEWQGYLGSGGWGEGHPYQRMYNPQAIETLSGEVIAVETVTPMQGMSPGVHVMLYTGKETVTVHLGPVWFIERLDTQIAKGDKIKVKGSKVIMNIEEKPGEMKAQHVLIASEVKKGDKVLILRNAMGEPVWSGWEKKKGK